MRAFAETKRIQRVFAHAKKPGEATMTVKINIYGSITDSDVIGDELSSAKLFLRDPSCTTGYWVSQSVYSWIFRNRGAKAGKSRSEFSCRIQQAIQDREGRTEEVRSYSFHYYLPIHDVIAKLEGKERWSICSDPTLTVSPSISIDLNVQIPIIKNHLYTNYSSRYQETALSFMIQREFGPVLPEYSLWKYEYSIKTALYTTANELQIIDWANPLAIDIDIDWPTMNRSMHLAS